MCASKCGDQLVLSGRQLSSHQLGKEAVPPALQERLEQRIRLLGCRLCRFALLRLLLLELLPRLCGSICRRLLCRALCCGG